MIATQYEPCAFLWHGLTFLVACDDEGWLHVTLPKDASVSDREKFDQYRQQLRGEFITDTHFRIRSND